MIRFVAALLMMTTGLLPVFGAGQNDFFTSAGSGKHMAARQSRHDDRAASERPDTRETKRERAHYTLLHFDSKLGNIALEPVVGKVNGAQLSLAW